MQSQWASSRFECLWILRAGGQAKIIVCDVLEAWGQPRNDLGRPGEAADKFRKNKKVDIRGPHAVAGWFGWIATDKRWS